MSLLFSKPGKLLPFLVKHSLNMKPENEEFDETVVTLDTYNSDLTLVIDATKYSAYPLTSEGFAFMWSGVRATHGANKGKFCFEVKILEHLDVSHLPADEPNPHVVRVGASVENSSLQLGEEPLSYGYGGTGKISVNCQFKDFGGTFTAGDCILCAVNFESDQVQIGYAKNGNFLGWAFEIKKPELQGKALFPHILTKNCSFEVNFGQMEKPYFDLPQPVKDYTYIGCIPLDKRIGGTRCPKQRGDCEMIMMCGLPGAGKSVWATEYASKHPEKKFNVLGTNNIIDKMKVMGLPRKKNYHGRWDVLIQMSTKCLNKLFEIGSKLRRNFILDQTNVYPTAQKRKMRNFEGFKRTAVVVVPTEEEFKRRCDKQERVEGKEIPEHAVLEMKANFKLPEIGDSFDDVIFTELKRDDAEKLVIKYNEEGKIAVGPSKKMFKPNEAGGNQGFDTGRSNFMSNRGGGFQRGRFDGGRGSQAGFVGNRGGFDCVVKDEFGNRGFDRGHGGFGGRGSFMGNRGGFEGSRGFFPGNRGGFDSSARGSFDGGRGFGGGRGSFDGGRGFGSGMGGFDRGRGFRGGRGNFDGGRGFGSGRGSFDNGRGGYVGGRGGFENRGGFGSRGGFDGNRGGFDGNRGGFGGGRGGFSGGSRVFGGGRGGFVGGRDFASGRGGFDGSRGGFHSGREGFGAYEDGFDSERIDSELGEYRGGFESVRNDDDERSFGNGRGSFDSGRGSRGGFASQQGSFESTQGNSHGSFNHKRSYNDGPGNNSGNYDSDNFNDNLSRNYSHEGFRGRGSSLQSSFSGRDYTENNQSRYESGKDSSHEPSNFGNQSNSYGGSFSSWRNTNSDPNNTTSNYNSQSHYSDYTDDSGQNYDQGYGSYRETSVEPQTYSSNLSSRNTSKSYAADSVETYKNEFRTEEYNVDNSKVAHGTGRPEGRISRWSAETTETPSHSQTAVTTAKSTYSTYVSSVKTDSVASSAPTQYATYTTYTQNNPSTQGYSSASTYVYPQTTVTSSQQWPVTQTQPPPPPPADQASWAQYYQQTQTSQYYSSVYGQPSATTPVAYTTTYETK